MCFSLPTTISAHFFSLLAPYRPMPEKRRVPIEKTYMARMPGSKFSTCRGKKENRDSTMNEWMAGYIDRLYVHVLPLHRRGTFRG